MNRQWLKTVLWSGVIASFAVGGRSLLRGQQAPAAHVVMTSQQDRQRVMDQLKITLFPNGPGAYLASTYDGPLGIEFIFEGAQHTFFAELGGLAQPLEFLLIPATGREGQ